MTPNIIELSGKPLELPAARSDGAKQLMLRAVRLPDWLPATVEARQFVMAVTAEANKLPADTDAGSVVKAAFNCAVLGLIPGEQLGHAHMIPFNDRQRGRICQLIIGYKGFLELAYGAGFLESVHCEVVLGNEDFRRWNDSAGCQLMHELPIERDEKWEDLKAAYCIWKPRNGRPVVELVGKKALQKLYSRGNVWKSEPIAMAKKTALRRAAKLWKITGRMGQAMRLDETAERDEPQPFVGGDIDDTEPESTASLADYEAKPAETVDEPAETFAMMAEPFVVKLRLTKDLEQSFGDVTADPGFEAMPTEAKKLVYAEHEQLKAKAEGKLFP